jgi:hypothetical protein
VEIYGRIRRAVLVEGRSQRLVARDFGLARVTVRKMLGYSIPPGYRRKEPPTRPKLRPWVGVIDTILEEDQSKPAEQRHTAQRIFDRLRAEHGFTGGYTIVKDYVRAAALRHREMFIPLAHAAGTAQADFGEALVIVGGEERKAHYLAIDLPPCGVLRTRCPECADLVDPWVGGPPNQRQACPPDGSCRELPLLSARHVRNVRAVAFQEHAH